MNTKKIEIKSCKECPHFNEERQYTRDSFEMVFKWSCKKQSNKTIAKYVEWRDENEIEIPKWCPL